MEREKRFNEAEHDKALNLSLARADINELTYLNNLLHRLNLTGSLLFYHPGTLCKKDKNAPGKA